MAEFLEVYYQDWTDVLIHQSETFVCSLYLLLKVINN